MDIPFLEIGGFFQADYKYLPAHCLVSNILGFAPNFHTGNTFLQRFLQVSEEKRTT